MAPFKVSPVAVHECGISPVHHHEPSSLTEADNSFHLSHTRSQSKCTLLQDECMWHDTTGWCQQQLKKKMSSVKQTLQNLILIL